MELEVVSYIYIDVKGIIEDYNLNANSNVEEIYYAIHDYTCGLDDCDYYAIGEKETDKIYNEIRNRIGEQTSLFEET